MDERYEQIQAGWSAHDRDGDKIGDIEELGQGYLLVTKGLIFPRDLYVPQSAIEEIDREQGQVWLNVGKSEVDDMGWDQPPTAGDAWSAGGVAGGGSAVMNNDVTTGDTTGATDGAAYGGTLDETSSARSGLTGGQVDDAYTGAGATGTGQGLATSDTTSSIGGPDYGERAVDADEDRTVGAGTGPAAQAPDSHEESPRH